MEAGWSPEKDGGKLRDVGKEGGFGMEGSWGREKKGGMLGWREAGADRSREGGM